MGLWAFIARRLVQSILVLLLVSIATFALVQAVPGDPIETVLGERAAGDPEIRAAAERRYGFDQPVHMQYIYFMRNLFRGDLGESITTRRPVMTDLQQFIPGTIELAFAAMAFRRGLRDPAGHFRGHPARPLARSHGPLCFAHRNVGARLLARAADAVRLFLQAAVAAWSRPARHGHARARAHYWNDHGRRRDCAASGRCFAPR